MRYFDHDTHAADDDAIMALRLENGSGAIDCYWTLLEKMYRDEAPLNLVGSNGETNMETKSVSHRLLIDVETLKTYVSTMLELGLMNGSLDCLYSDRAMQNIEAYQAKAETARQNGKKGGRKPTKKPKHNRVGSKEETDKEPSGLQEKKRKDIGLDKLNLYQSSDGADAEKPAPPSDSDDSKVPVCPLCSKRVTFDAKSLSWRCPICGTVKEPSFVPVGDAA
jgi:hypothetical protein